MEFSFGPKPWLPPKLLEEGYGDCHSYALGLHAPGFFDKILNVHKCLLQSEAANKVGCLSIDFFGGSFLLVETFYRLQVYHCFSFEVLSQCFLHLSVSKNKTYHIVEGSTFSSKSGFASLF